MSSNDESRAGAFADELMRLRAQVEGRTLSSVNDMKELKAYLLRTPAEIAPEYRLSRAEYERVYEGHVRDSLELLRRKWPAFFDASQPTVGYLLLD